MIWYCSVNHDNFRVFCDDKLQGTYPRLREPFCSICSNPGINTESCDHSDLYGFDRIHVIGLYNKDREDLLSEHIRKFKESASYCHPLGIALGILAHDIYPELSRSDVIVPVPLHKEKLSERRFNQSLELCKVVRNRINKDVAEVLVKTRNIDMHLMGKIQRKEAVQGLYQVIDSAKSHVQGKRVLLVDDVITSGFTVSECSQILKNSGARSVNILAAGRTPLQSLIAHGYS